MNKIKRQERLAKLKEKQRIELAHSLDDNGIMCDVLCSKCGMCEHHCECEEFED